MPVPDKIRERGLPPCARKGWKPVLPLIRTKQNEKVHSLHHNGGREARSTTGKSTHFRDSSPPTNPFVKMTKSCIVALRAWVVPDFLLFDDGRTILKKYLIFSRELPIR